MYVFLMIKYKISVSFACVNLGNWGLHIRYHSRFFDCLAHPNLKVQHWPQSRVPFTIVLFSLINTIVNGTLLNFGKRYEDDLTEDL